MALLPATPLVAIALFSDGPLQERLSAWNHERLAPQLPTPNWRENLDAAHQMARDEGAFVEQLRADVAEWLPRLLPARGGGDPEVDFLAWFASLERTGPGQSDPLFDYLRDDATLPELLWFLRQEVAGEAGFDDLVAMAQIRLPTRPKLECARNYWDEMGRGKAPGMHGPMLSALARDLALPSGDIVPEARAVGNLLVAFAANRRYAYHALGALGAVELTAPARARAVNEAMKRLGVAPRTRRYYALHATLDVVHSRDWNAEVLAPLVKSDPRTVLPLAEGAVLRLAAGAAAFARYRRELGLGGGVHWPQRGEHAAA